MAGWLKRLFGGGARPSTAPSFGELVALGRALTHAEADHLAAALTRIMTAGPESDASRRAREDLRAWYVKHPLELRWEQGFHVVDPLGITTDHLVPDDEPATLVAWAPWMRSLAMTSGGANAFHHGWTADEVLVVLEDPNLPEAIEWLELPSFVARSDQEVTDVIERIAAHPNLSGLRHLGLQAVHGLTPEHVLTLAGARWAAGLSTLDLTERFTDMEPAHRRVALERLGEFSQLTHLVLYNSIIDVDDLAALLSHPFRELRVLDLGHGPTDAAGLRLLLETTALPQLEEARGIGGPPFDHEVWHEAVAAPFRVYKGATPVTEVQLEEFADRRRTRDQSAPPVPDPLTPPHDDAVIHDGGVSSKVVRSGTGGKHPTLGSQVSLRYAGWSSEGTLFDCNYDRPRPMTIELRHADRAWHDVVRQMLPGEVRLVWAPAKEPAHRGFPVGPLVYQLELISSE